MERVRHERREGSQPNRVAAVIKHLITNSFVQFVSFVVLGLYSKSSFTSFIRSRGAVVRPTGHLEDLFHAAIDLGARGYILKESALTEIAHGLRAVADGQHYVSAPLTAYLFNRRRRAEALAQSHPALHDLTSTERSVLRAIADYRSSKDIAAELFLSYRTVENHRTNVCRKLGLHGSHALLKFALEHKSEL